ncbi:MAG: tyrosine-type recombinase/integrase [Fuerstiella sp.]
MRIPKLQHYKPKGLARVRLPQPGGKARIVYLGKWGSDEARKRYDEVIAQWLLKQRRTEAVALTMNRLCVAYLDHVDSYYLKNGKPTTEASVMRLALRHVTRACGHTLTRDFGPALLKTIRENMVDAGWTRKSINQQINRIRRMLKWGVEQDLVTPDVLHRCQAVAPLSRGRTVAPETQPVRPVDLADITAVKRHVRPVVWDMIRLQYRTGMRPGEVRTMTVGDLDLSGDEWLYRPASHKTEHHGRERVIVIGSRSQRILRKYLTADRGRFLFESVRAKSYTKDSYNRAIARACKLAGISTWSPNRLRHTFATRANAIFGIEATRTSLGHASADMTQIYAERDLEAARRVARAIG